ncbi:hypothetical protein J2Z69_002491 [Paenibacillus shirakamiensis]|uniref:DUF4177 domain-containing protein n=1 Tax=Paenibacillus shirakamiensis TaxID=1265935 RepID=A0ABS4JKD5_9BACL|nr:DUF4177 domain-containing protein [Paenibacillus shirakamiensis]MBP2001446.1 hypothetical protein [Paenibacillus shirakamiensis]
MPKYEYDYVCIVAGGFSGKLREDYRPVITQYAAEGWKLHSIVPMPLISGGQASTVDLIFERIIE